MTQTMSNPVLHGHGSRRHKFFRHLLSQRWNLLLLLVALAAALALLPGPYPPGLLLPLAVTAVLVLVLGAIASRALAHPSGHPATDTPTLQDAAAAVTRPIDPSADSHPHALDGAVFQELRETLGEQHDAIAAIYARFVESAGVYIGEIRDQAGAARTRALHTLHGSAGMVGATRIATVAARLHQAFLQSSAATSDASIRLLEDELSAFRRELAAHLASLGEETQH